MEENKRKTHHPDDNLFKKVMEEKENAQAYLSEFYPELAKHLDLEKLKIQPESFLTANFDLFKSDILYRCPFKGTDEQIYFALILWEHKVKPEKWIAVQLGLYIFLALDKMLRTKGQKVEPIIPLLFYNGEKPWVPKTLRELFSDLLFYNLIEEFIPDFKFLFKNIHGTSTENLIKINTAFFRSAMIAMAHRKRMDLIYTKFSFIFDLEDAYHLEILMTYVLSFTNLPTKEIRKTFKHMDLTIDNDRMMSTLEMLLKEGEEIGIKKGEEIGIKKGEVIGIKKSKAILSLTNLLKLIQKFPKMKLAELASFTEIKAEKIKKFLTILATKNKKNIQKHIDVNFLAEVELTKSEKVKISKLLTQISKK